MIRGNLPKHMEVAARTGFLRAYRESPSQWRAIATEHTIDSKYEDLVDLGDAPMPIESKSGLTAQDFIERTLRVEPKSFDITVHISYNAVQDDQTDSLFRRCQGAGRNFNRHFDKLVFQALNGGDGSTYGLCYDGQYFFDTDHVDIGAAYTTAQSNTGSSALTPDAFETAWVAASTRLTDQGEQSGIVPNLLVVPPAYAREGKQLADNEMISTTANNELNPWQGVVSYLVNPHLDSTSWFLLATNENIKPLMLIMREQPSLQEQWFEPSAPDGGHYYLKFYGRYNVAYTDWRLATLGNT